MLYCRAAELRLRADQATLEVGTCLQHWQDQRNTLLTTYSLVPQIVVPSLGLSAAVPSGPHTAYLVLSAVNGTGGQLTVVNGKNTSEGPAGNQNAPASSTAARTAPLLLLGALQLPLFGGTISNRCHESNAEP